MVTAPPLEKERGNEGGEERARGGEMREGGGLREKERAEGREVRGRGEGKQWNFRCGLCFASSLLLPSGAMVAYLFLCVPPCFVFCFSKNGEGGEWVEAEGRSSGVAPHGFAEDCRMGNQAITMTHSGRT